MKNKIRRIVVILFIFVGLSGCSGNHSTIEETDFVSSNESGSAIAAVSETEKQNTFATLNEETTSTELIIPEEYDEVLDSIVDCIDNFEQNGINTIYGNEYGGGVWELCHLENVKDLLAYAFVDIDGDNVAELLILDCGYVGSSDRPRITDLYTFYNNEVKSVMSGGVRARCYLSNEMILFCDGSSGAMYSSVSRYSFKPDSDKLIFLDCYYTIPNDDGDGDILCYTTERTSILSNDVDSSNVEIISSFDFLSNIYEDYGLKDEDLYDYARITTFAEYCSG